MKHNGMVVASQISDSDSQVCHCMRFLESMRAKYRSLLRSGGGPVHSITEYKPKISEREVDEVERLRETGMTFEKVGVIMGRSGSSCAKHLRDRIKRRAAA